MATASPSVFYGSRRESFMHIYKLIARGRLPKARLRYVARDHKTPVRAVYYDMCSAYPASMMADNPRHAGALGRHAARAMETER